jgi:transposase
MSAFIEYPVSSICPRPPATFSISNDLLCEPPRSLDRFLDSKRNGTTFLTRSPLVAFMGAASATSDDGVREPKPLPDTRNGWNAMDDNIRKRRRYTRVFKLKAVRQVLEDGHSAAEVERTLGTGRGIIARWVRELGNSLEGNAPGADSCLSRSLEIASLKQELERVTRERDAFKKTIAILTTIDTDRGGSGS